MYKQLLEEDTDGAFSGFAFDEGYVQIGNDNNNHKRNTFKSPKNCEVVKLLVKEVRMLNPQFQAGHIRCK
jgi:hypothetical protein